MDGVLKAVADYGITLVALVLVTGFLAWFIRSVIDDLRKQRDAAMSGWQGQIAATDKLADSVAVLSAIIRDRRRT